MKNIDITVILDKSSSMAKVRKETIEGFNSYLNSQKKDKAKLKLSLVQFNSKFETIYDAIDIKYVPELTTNTYITSGYTAFLDALGTEMNKCGRRLAAMDQKDRPDSVVFVIITDGQDNSSKYYTKAKIQEMISHQKDVYKWDFIFIGANFDAVTVANQIGIEYGKTMNYDTTAIGTQTVFSSLDRMSKAYSRGNLKCTNFTQEERNEAVK